MSALAIRSLVSLWNFLSKESKFRMFWFIYKIDANKLIVEKVIFSHMYETTRIGDFREKVLSFVYFYCLRETVHYSNFPHSSAKRSNISFLLSALMSLSFLLYSAKRLYTLLKMYSFQPKARFPHTTKIRAALWLLIYCKCSLIKKIAMWKLLLIREMLSELIGTVVSGIFNFWACLWKLF